MCLTIAELLRSAHPELVRGMYLVAGSCWMLVLVGLGIGGVRVSSGSWCLVAGVPGPEFLWPKVVSDLSVDL